MSDQTSIRIGVSIGATIGSYCGRVSVPADSYGRAMEEECKVEYCERLAYTRGFCQMHYRRVLRTGDAGPPGSMRQRSICSVVGCDKQVDAKELCHGHYQRLLRHGDVGDAPLRSSGRLCSVPDCRRPHKAFGYCPAHYKRFLVSGNPQADRPIREVAGEGFLNHGYWIVPVPKTVRWLVGELAASGSIGWLWLNTSAAPSAPMRWSTIAMVIEPTIESRILSFGSPHTRRVSVSRTSWRSALRCWPDMPQKSVPGQCEEQSPLETTRAVPSGFEPPFLA